MLFTVHPRTLSQRAKFTGRQEVQGFAGGRPPVLRTPPFASMEELMGGELVYVVAVPDTPGASLTVQVFFCFVFAHVQLPESQSTSDTSLPWNGQIGYRRQ